MTRYYFKLHSEGRVYGPFSSSELRGLARSGRLRQSDLISPGRSNKWIPAHEVRNLPFQASDSAETGVTDLDVETAAAGVKGSGFELSQSDGSIDVARQHSEHFLMADARAVSAVDIARAPFTSWTLVEGGLNCLIILGWTVSIAAMVLLLSPTGVEGALAVAFTLVAAVLAAGHLLKRYLTICRAVVLDDPDHDFSFRQCVWLALQMSLLGPLPMAASVGLLVESVGDGVLWLGVSTVLCLFMAAWMAILYPMILIHLAVNRRINLRMALQWVRQSLSDVLVIYGSLVVVTGILSGLVALLAWLGGPHLLENGILALALFGIVLVTAQYVSTAYYVMLSLAVRKNGLFGGPTNSFVDASIASSFSLRSQGTPLGCCGV